MSLFLTVRKGVQSFSFQALNVYRERLTQSAFLSKKDELAVYHASLITLIKLQGEEHVAASPDPLALLITDRIQRLRLNAGYRKVKDPHQNKRAPEVDTLSPAFYPSS